MRSLTASTLLAAALLAGCETKAPAPTPSATNVPVELKPVTVAQLTEFLTEQKGKVVLIDCWSLT
jgi:hypothetical protein